MSHRVWEVVGLTVASKVTRADLTHNGIGWTLDLCITCGHACAFHVHDCCQCIGSEATLCGICKARATPLVTR